MRLAAVLLMTFACQALPTSALADEPTQTVVTTLAGSGASGVTDGDAAHASFLAPAAVADARNGHVLVADAAGQRIRDIAPDGTVTTLAGGGPVDSSGTFVVGGYVDGPARSARFSEPSGLVVRSDGGVYVADTGNHCIRLIKGGFVSTYAGDPAHPSARVGTIMSAGFLEPRGLAIDPHDDLYVADLVAGVRKIDSHGGVTVVDLPPNRGTRAAQIAYEPTGLGGTKNHESLFVALESGVAVVELGGSGKETFYEAGTPPVNYDVSHAYVAGAHAAGHAYGIAVLPSIGFVYSDAWSHSLRVVYAAASTFRTLAGSADENAAYDGGAFRDGSGEEARFDTPLGIVRLTDGTIVVADSGNRRIREVRPPAYRPIGGYEQIDAMAAAPQTYRIAYVGNSVVRYDTPPNDTIGAHLENDLNASPPRPAGKKTYAVYSFPVVGGTSATGSFIQEELANGVADLIVWQLNSSEIAALKEVSGGDARGIWLPEHQSVWQPLVARDIRAVVEACRENGVALVLSVNPMPTELAPSETLYGKLYFEKLHSFAQYQEQGRLVRKAAADSGVPTIDLFPTFLEAETEPLHPALFSTLDYHFSTEGSRVVERGLFQGLERIAPWATR